MDKKKQLFLIKNLLSYSDNKNDILSIAEKTNLPIEDLIFALDICIKNKLIKKLK
jgi:aminopeptidase-like protein